DQAKSVSSSTRRTRPIGEGSGRKGSWSHRPLSGPMLLMGTSVTVTRSHANIWRRVGADNLQRTLGVPRLKLQPPKMVLAFHTTGAIHHGWKGWRDRWSRRWSRRWSAVWRGRMPQGPDWRQ